MIFEGPGYKVTRRFVKSQALLIGDNGMKTKLVLQIDRDQRFSYLSLLSNKEE